MSLLKKFKEFDEKIGIIRNKINLSKKFPQYIHKIVFRIAFLIIAIIVILDIYIGHGINHFSLSCPENSPQCKNPFYVCNQDERDRLQYFDNGMTERCRLSVPDYICDTGACEKKYLQPGESYGRQDFLARYGILSIFLILAGAFIVNHIIYMMVRK